MAIIVNAANPYYSSLDGVLFNKSQTTLLTFPGGKGGSYTIPTNVTTIGVSGFESCTKLRSVTIPDSVNSIGDEAFGTCTSLTNFNIPTNVTRIGPFTFIGCGSLTSVTIPGNVRTIEDNAFSFCSNLTSVTISEGVTGILFQTFYRSDKLTNMVIPRSVTSIVRSPFPTGPGLQGLFFKGNAPIVLLGLTLATNTTVYYLPGATGWGATFGGVPARLWNPGIQTSAANFGVRTNRFGFNITGTPNIPIVLEAAADLGGAWTVLRSLNLTNGLFYFSDPAWINHPARTYRIRSP